MMMMMRIERIEDWVARQDAMRRRGVAQIVMGVVVLAVLVWVA